MYQIQSKNKSVVIWGIGEIGRPLIATIRKCNVKYYLGDNKKSLWNLDVGNNDVVKSPSWIKSNVADPVFLITSPFYYDDIINELKRKFHNMMAVDIFSYLKYDLTVDECIEEL